MGSLSPGASATGATWVPSLLSPTEVFSSVGNCAGLVPVKSDTLTRAFIPHAGRRGTKPFFASKSWQWRLRWQNQGAAVRTAASATAGFCSPTARGQAQRPTERQALREQPPGPLPAPSSIVTWSTCWHTSARRWPPSGMHPRRVASREHCTALWLQRVGQVHGRQLWQWLKPLSPGTCLLQNSL